MGKPLPKILDCQSHVFAITRPPGVTPNVFTCCTFRTSALVFEKLPVLTDVLLQLVVLILSWLQVAAPCALFFPLQMSFCLGPLSHPASAMFTTRVTRKILEYSSCTLTNLIKGGTREANIIATMFNMYLEGNLVSPFIALPGKLLGKYHFGEINTARMCWTYRQFRTLHLRMKGCLQRCLPCKDAK